MPGLVNSIHEVQKLVNHQAHCTSATHQNLPPGNADTSQLDRGSLGRSAKTAEVRKEHTCFPHFPGGEASETVGGHTPVTELAHGNPFHRPTGHKQMEKTCT